MNNYISKKALIIINIILFLIECLLFYFMIKSILTKDLISPDSVNVLEYLRVKFSNII